MSNRPVQVGVDLGGTKVHSVVLGEDLQILSEDTRLSGFGPEEVMQNLRESISDALSFLSHIAVTSIGIGTPGTVDVRTGIVRHSLNLGIQSLDLRTPISGLFECSVQVENDVNATALGLTRLFPKHESLCYLNFGTGLAAGFVINGRVWSGASGLAGEIGHIPISGKNNQCSCGQAGCLELFSSWSGLRKQLPGYETLTDALGDRGTVPAVAEAWEAFISNAVLSIQTVFLTLDPEVIFIGGGVVASSTEVFDEIVARVVDLEQKAPLFAEKGISKRIARMPHNVPVAAIGALG